MGIAISLGFSIIGAAWYLNNNNKVKINKLLLGEFLLQEQVY